MCTLIGDHWMGHDLKNCSIKKSLEETGNEKLGFFNYFFKCLKSITISITWIFEDPDFYLRVPKGVVKSITNEVFRFYLNPGP